MKRKSYLWILIGLPVLALLGVGGYFGYVAFEDAQLRARLKSADPHEIQKACYDIADTGSPRFLPDVIALLDASDHDDVREAAGYAIHRIELQQPTPAPAGVDALFNALERQDDDIIRAKLITYWARLVGDNATTTLVDWRQGAEPWRAAGAAIALLESGHADAVQTLFRTARTDPHQLRIYSADELRKMVAPMAEMIGDRLDLNVDPMVSFTPDQLAAIEAWWAGPRTPELLQDHLEWHQIDNPQWRLIKRMLHARDQASGWVGLKD